MLTAISWRMRWVLLGVVGLWPFVFASTVSAAPILQMGSVQRLKPGEARSYGTQVTRHKGFNEQYYFGREISCRPDQLDSILREARAAETQGIGPKVLGHDYDPNRFAGRIFYEDLSLVDNLYEPIAFGTLDNLEDIHKHYNFDSTAAKSIRERVLNVIRGNPDKKIFWRLVDTQDGVRFQVFKLGASPRQLTIEEQWLDSIISEQNPWVDPPKSIREVHRILSEKLGLFNDLPPDVAEASPLFEGNSVTLYKRRYLARQGRWSDVRSFGIPCEQSLIDISDMEPRGGTWSLSPETNRSPNRLNYRKPPRLISVLPHQAGFAQGLRGLGWIGFVYECNHSTITTDNLILLGVASNAVWKQFEAHARNNLRVLRHTPETFNGLSPTDQQDIRNVWLTTFLMNQKNQTDFSNLDAFEQRKIRELALQWIP